MKKILSPLFSIFQILFITFFLFLVLDYFLGSKFVAYLDGNNEREFRILNATYSHTLRSNYNGMGKWDTYYKICTNQYGFKFDCNKNVDLKENSYDLVFIGDSFTEAIGMPYENSFVGMIEKFYPNLKIANMGVSSYSPSIYYSKFKYFIEKGMKIKNVVVYLDRVIFLMRKKELWLMVL